MRKSQFLSMFSKGRGKAARFWVVLSAIGVVLTAPLTSLAFRANAPDLPDTLYYDYEAGWTTYLVSAGRYAERTLLIPMITNPGQVDDFFEVYSAETPMFRVNITKPYQDQEQPAPNQVKDPSFGVGETLYLGGGVTRKAIVSQNLQYNAPVLLDLVVEEPPSPGYPAGSLDVSHYHWWTNEMEFEMDVDYDEFVVTYHGSFDYYDSSGPSARYKIFDE